ncbi:helix-turn-helix domain-containing protein [Thermomonas haemolytica]|uniref:Xre family transcriptional regulator n=1 Tax=Thermomonas haemolytica TaxID=141949 RepID=A0A4R3N1F4_9GAMM|nr:helix-turn-helix transcriptional regulator [Thermomonas haemolytica]TCT22544.1 Xre family transcriptional regulator [Thermomonas haemolytica]TNY29212.1 Cro/Cl family transcriptional regulator [Thermomonas haemolytica]
MPIRITLDAMLARRGMTARELAATVGISETQMSLFRSGKVKGIRFRTLARLCAALGCAPGDLLDYAYDADDLRDADEGADGED